MTQTPKKLEIKEQKDAPVTPGTPNIEEKVKEGTKDIEDYFAKHNIQQLLESALNECFKQKSENPTLFLSDYFKTIAERQEKVVIKEGETQTEMVSVNGDVHENDDHVKAQLEELSKLKSELQELKNKPEENVTTVTLLTNEIVEMKKASDELRKEYSELQKRYEEATAVVEKTEPEPENAE